jgi:DNA-binding NarL/FixJ family response regulator
MHKRYQVILADDHTILRKGLRSILETTEDFQVIGEAGDGHELLNLLHEGVVPDALIRQMNFVFKTLVLTMHKEPDILCRAFSVGADGYMLKDGMARELLIALHILLEGKIYLSPFMKGELPDICQVKAFAGREPSSSQIMHCGKNCTGPLFHASTSAP